MLNDEIMEYIMLSTQQIIPKTALEGNLKICLLKGEVELEVQIEIQVQI